ncbi:hypothetical protein [Leucobacter sp.]
MTARALLVSLGVAGLIVYAILGALLMSDWAVTAASGVPLEQAVAAMDAAGQPYGVWAGIGFATIGILLALGWAALALLSREKQPGWVLLLLFGCILAAGAPAYFFASFGNLNSVGDTFVDWDADAAFALELPLYLVSALGAGAVLVAVVLGLLAGPLHARRGDVPPASASGG